MKMTKNFDDLNDTFNTSGDVIKPEVVESKIEKVKEGVDDIKKDYEYTRGNLYSIIEKGQEALNGVLELAQESEMPRAYEVAGQLIKNVADATDKLMDLQKKLKDVEDKWICRLGTFNAPHGLNSRDEIKTRSRVNFGRHGT